MLKTKIQSRKVYSKNRRINLSIDNKTLEKIKRTVEIEFPNDEALQQVHVARKIISLEAKAKGMSLIDYIKNCSGNL